jgi:uncharacterized membrane protein YhaH (DUF805 family)
METNLFSAEGRIRRSTYWGRNIIGTAIIVATKLLSVPYEALESFSLLSFSLLSFSLLIRILVTIFLIIQGIKRMHDVNKPGWYILIPIYSLVLYFTNGTKGNNEYGEDPKEVNPNSDDFDNSFLIVLFSAFISCISAAFLGETKIIDGLANATIIKSVLFIILFVASNYYFLESFRLKSNAVKS